LPIGVALVVGVLLAPRRPEPEGIPLPIADRHALASAIDADRALAQAGRQEPLPGSVRALGSAIRDFHALEADAGQASDLGALSQARHAVDVALIDATALGPEPFLRLRALQLEGFLAETRKFSESGEQSPELKALAGGFVRSMTLEGWCEGHSLAAEPVVLRVMFKQMWNAFLGLDRRDGAVAEPTGAALALTLDEQRTLYAFYLSHPHPSRASRDAIASAQKTATDAKSCHALRVTERAAIDSWCLDHITRIAAVDPAYPADYARGIARFGRGEYRASAAAFQKWLDGHPDGPLALRAQNYLRAAAEADSLE
jgi:hypothetical protein